jgi:hypothetical protein
MTDFIPTSGDSSATNDGLAGYSQFTRKHVEDRPIDLLFSPQMSGLNGTGLTLVGSGPPAQTHVNSSLALSIRFATTDTHGVLWRIPGCADLTKDVDFRLKISCAGAAAAGSTAVFAWLYKSLIDATTAIAVPTTAMDSNSTAQVSFGANVGGRTGWNTITGGKLIALKPGTDMLGLKLTCTLATLTSCDVWFGEVRYYAKRLNSK